MRKKLDNACLCSKKAEMCELIPYFRNNVLSETLHNVFNDGDLLVLIWFLRTFVFSFEKFFFPFF